MNQKLLATLIGTAVVGIIILIVDKNGFKKVSRNLRDSASGALDDTLERLSKGELDLQES